MSEQSKRARARARDRTDVINGINVNATLIDTGITTFLLLLALPLFHVRAIHSLQMDYTSSPSKHYSYDDFTS